LVFHRDHFSPRKPARRSRRLCNLILALRRRRPRI
jgi:hypothetical protein